MSIPFITVVAVQVVVATVAVFRGGGGGGIRSCLVSPKSLIERLCSVTYRNLYQIA